MFATLYTSYLGVLGVVAFRSYAIWVSSQAGL
jgi:hypothetical protein